MSTELRKLRSAGNEGPDFIRPLGCGEHFFHLYAQVYPVHFSLCAEIAGAVDSDALRSALNQVRERHPILKARIADDGKFGTAFYTSDRPIELETIAVGKDADWRPVVERELRKPMDIGANALLRATALGAPDTTVIVLTFYHAIADGMSGVWVLHDLMRALAGEQLEACRFPPPVEEKILRSSLAPAHEWPAGAWEADRIMPILPKIRSAVPVVPDNLRTNIVTGEFSQEETARLLERCRANDTTVHGLICAAASRHVPASDHDIVRVICPIDLRNIAGIENGVCGVFIGASSFELPIGGTTSIWHDARHIVHTIAQSRSPEAAIEFMSRMSAEFPPTAQSEKLGTFFSAGPQNSLVVSNLGALPIAERYGPYVVKAVWGPAMLTNLPEDRQTLGVSTFGGRLRIVHQSYVPIRGLVPAIRNSLLTACG
jgi:NRPS condensation-like uncharacterized protein